MPLLVLLALRAPPFLIHTMLMVPQRWCCSRWRT